MSDKHTPETQPDEENAISSFTLANDEIPPGMDEDSVPNPSSYGVASRPVSSNFSYLSSASSSLVDDEPEVYLPTGRRKRETSLERLSEYCPEDVASDFFEEEERLPHVHLEPAKILTQSTADSLEQPSSMNSGATTQPLVVMGETIHGNEVDEAAEMKHSVRLCAKLSFIFLGGAVLAIVLLLTPANKVFDTFDRKSSDGSSAALNNDPSLLTISPTPSPTIMLPVDVNNSSPPSPTSSPVIQPTTPNNPTDPTTTISTSQPSTTTVSTSQPSDSAPKVPTSRPSIAPSTSPTSFPSSFPTSAPTGEFIRFGGTDGATDDLFAGNQANVELGTSVSLADDSKTMTVGSRDNVVNIFAFNGTNWSTKGSPVIGGPNVVVSGDGLVMVAGDPTSDSEQGRILTYFYNQLDDRWDARGSALIGNQTTLADSSTGGSQLGSVMVLSFDGSVLMTGEPLVDKGAGRVKRYESIGGDWIENTDFLVSSSAGEEMGSSIDMSSDGSLVAIGSPGGDGKVSTYSFSGTSISQVGSTVSGGSGDGLGKQVAVVENKSGTRILAALKATGEASIYRVTGNKWNRVYTSSGGELFTHLRMGINSETEKFTVALGYSTCNLVPCLVGGDTGRVKLVAMRQNVNQWGEDGDFEVAPGLNSKDMALDMAHDTSVIAVGAPGSNASGSTLSGQVYVFKRSAG